jgi:hypothetical protein
MSRRNVTYEMLSYIERKTALNTASNDTPVFEKNYCGRSIVVLRVLVDNAFLSLHHNGVVCRDVSRNVFGHMNIPIS